MPSKAGQWITSNCDPKAKKCQVSPFFVLSCPSLPPTPFSHISYLSCSQYPFLHPENNAFVLLLNLLLPIPSSLSIPPSICLVLSVTSLPCQAMRERGRDRPCHCLLRSPRNINSVFLEQERRALASNLSDLMMSGPLFFWALYMSFFARAPVSAPTRS